jgi:hypothetical protein
MAAEHGSIATLVRTCVEGFERTCKALAEAEPNVQDKLPSEYLSECFGRFRVWAGNCGAHRRGPASLEYKLREASHIRNMVLSQLLKLQIELSEALEIVTGQRVPWEEDPSESSDSDSDDSERSSQMSEDPPELAQKASYMYEIVRCLSRLAMAYRNPAPHDQFRASVQWDKTFFQPYDALHVESKFPKAANFLIQRLGKAISRRRQYLQYRKEHRSKLEMGLDTQRLEVLSSEPRSALQAPQSEFEVAASTVASSLPSRMKTIVNSTEYLDLDKEFPDETSQTSFASSSYGAFRLRPPCPPRASSDGEPFECPLCFRFTSVRKVREWNKHMYRDLQPYVSARC